MQDDKTHNTEQDRFDRLLGSRLEGYRIPVDANCWEEIEKKIKPKHRKIVWWYVGSAAAIIGLLMLFILPLKDNVNRDNTVAETNTIMKPEEKSIDAQKDKVQEKMDSTKENKEIVPAHLHATVTSNTRIRTSNVNKTQNIDNVLPTYPENDSEITIITTTEEQHESGAKDTVDTKRNFELELMDKYFVLDDKPLLAKTNQNDGWTFGMNVSGGGSAFNTNSFEYNGQYDYAKPPGEDLTSGIPIAEKEWDVDYRLPVSVGFLVKKDFNRTVGLETGLIYTYLSSDMKRDTYNSKDKINTSQKGTTQIHYLGIPLNLVVKAWNNPNWDIYVSGGVMLEKGISMKQKIRTYKNGEETDVERENKNWVHGAQWSINGAVGVSYKITSSWSLYIEPRISHYYNNKQPISIRTEKPTLFNLSGGVKFNLK